MGSSAIRVRRCGAGPPTLDEPTRSGDRQARRGDLSVTDRVAREELTLPLWSYMDEAGCWTGWPGRSGSSSRRHSRRGRPVRRRYGD